MEGTDPDKLQENINKKKKLNIKKVNKVVDRLYQPKESKPKRDPDQEELKQILNKYTNSDRRIGGGATKKFEYINPLPDKSSPMVAKKNVKFLPEYNKDLVINEDVEGENIMLSTINKEEERLKNERKIIDTLLTNKSQLETNKVSEHFTLMDQGINEILGNQDDKTLIEVSKENKREERKEIEPSPVRNSETIEDDLKYVKDHLEVPVKDTLARNSIDSLNDRVSLNKDLDISDEHSDFNTRDIDLEEKYNEMIKGKTPDDVGEDKFSDVDSLNDIDEDLTKLYTGL